jgi:hypothetical protein
MRYLELIIPLIGLACVIIITVSITLLSYSRYLEAKRIEWQNKELIIQECKNMGMKEIHK